MKNNICVLLASYNGEKYIDEQLNSLITQTIRPDRIIVSDDSSNDTTFSKLQSWQSHYPEIIEVHINSSGRKGHVGNFSFLSELALQTDSDYFLFSDQDDKWHVDKIEKMMLAMRDIESCNSCDLPVLVHSDLKVVDEDLHEIHDSFFLYQGLPNPKEHGFPRFFYQNSVTGCATLFNKRLLKLAAPLPQAALVHDFWFALVAYSFGRLHFIDESLVDYRQHGSNAIGAQKKSKSFGLLSLNYYKNLLAFPGHIAKCIRQAREIFFLAKKYTLIEKFALIHSGSLRDAYYSGDYAVMRQSFIEVQFCRLSFLISRWL